jgi:CO/xanthine dehydrogenase FAD-binding subunit
VDGHRCQAVTPSDLATVLLALDAEVEIAHGTRRRVVPIGTFYSGPGETVLRDGELVTAVTIPAGALGRAAAFTKLALYTGDFATASAALAVVHGSDGTWRDVRLVLGAMAPTPWRLTAVEDALRGTAPDLAAVRRLVDAELDAHAHPLRRNAWKLDAAAGLVERAVEALPGAGA